MAAATSMRKSVSINNYPEHLNPFREEEHHNRLRFWTLGRKSGRRESFSLNNIKDLRNTWSLKSFMKRSKKGQENQNDVKPKPSLNGDSSPVQFRRAMEYSSTAASAGSTSQTPERYVYGGSVTPLPRSRFQERMSMRSANPAGPNQFTHMSPGRASFSHRSGEAYPLPGLARSDLGDSRLSVTTTASTNPFDEDTGPVVPARRKKKRAPLPPSLNNSAVSQSSSVAGAEESPKKKQEVLVDDQTLNVELKIVEDVDDKQTHPKTKEMPSDTTNVVIEASTLPESKAQIQENTTTNEEVKDNSKNVTIENIKNIDINNADAKINDADVKINDADVKVTSHSPVEIRKQDSTDSDGKDVVFQKVNIRLYRRNSSANSDKINIENNNVEFSPNNKRCKSLNNNTDPSFGVYDIPLHIDEDSLSAKDINDNTAGPQKVVCKLLQPNTPRKPSVDNSMSSTEREFIEIDRATRELEHEINKLNSFKYIDDDLSPKKPNGNSVFAIKCRFEKPDKYSPNPIPKPRRTRAGSASPEHP